MLKSVQKEAIDKMDEAQLRKTSSINSHNKEIVAYIDERLEALNAIDNAMVEYTPLDDFGEQ